MNCPGCGQEMEQGWLLCSPPVLWSKNPNKVSTLLTADFMTPKGDVRLRTDKTGRPPAWICRNCQKVIVDY